MNREVLILLLFCCGFAFGYEVGVTYKYSYETTTTLDENCLSENDLKVVGHRLTAQVHLTPIWQNSKNPSQQLFKIEISKTKLSISKKTSYEEYTSELDKLSSKPSFVLREKGSLLKVFDDQTENIVLRNIKRGIASLLETRKRDPNEREAGVSGTCNVIYDESEGHVQKRKTNCIHSKFDKSLSQPYGVRSMSIQHLLSTDCELDGKSNILTRCSATEYVKSFSNIWRKPSLCVNAKSEFLFKEATKGNEIYKKEDFENVISELKKTYTENLVEGDLEAILIRQQQVSQNNPADHLKKYQESLKDENLAKLKSAVAFYKLLPSFHSATKEQINKILQSKNFKPTLGQILDLIATSSNENALQAAFEHFRDETAYNEMLERFLISLSVIPRPREYVLKEIKDFIESKERHEKIQATLISTLGAVLKTYSQNYQIADDKVLESHRTYLEKKLDECTTVACISTVLRGLRNSAFPRSAPLLLEHALKGGKSALEALLAVRNIEVKNLPTQIVPNLLKVFLQMGTKQDRSTRSIAADILLDMQPQDNVLKAILSTLSDQTDAEFSTFLVSKIFQKIKLDRELRSRVFKLLPEKYISYYYSFSQKGSSSLFIRSMINSEEMNITYGMQMEMLEGNLLKRSTFDVNFEYPETSNLLKVGMFGEGISSLAGGSGDDSATPTAGMELTVLGSSLRPYIFFTGTSELMGHAWSGTASSPTPALQGIFAFSDDENIVVLHNGMTAQMQLRGTLSTDLSASIQISLWSQNSQSQVKNAAALLMRGAVTVDIGFSAIQGAFQFSGQSAIDFSTYLVFSESPFQMCLQMEHPDISFKYDTHRSVTVTGTKYSLRRTKKRKREIPGRSFALHERNNEQCRQLN